LVIKSDFAKNLFTTTMNYQGVLVQQEITVACFGQSGAGKTTFLKRYSGMAVHSDFLQEPEETITIRFCSHEENRIRYSFKLIDCHGISDDHCPIEIFDKIKEAKCNLFLIFMRTGRMIHQERTTLGKNLKKFNLTPQNTILVLTHFDGQQSINDWLITSSEHKANFQIQNAAGQNINVIKRADGHTNESIIKDLIGFMPNVIYGDLTKPVDYVRMGSEAIQYFKQANSDLFISMKSSCIIS
jgi:energy-coupling factor transporter ATP-binding protein EcfA2